jgi:transketolase
MIEEKMIKQWARLGMRGTMGQFLWEEAEHNKKLMLISADLGVTSGFSKFMNDYPEQFLNVGIAEQNMIGVATGLSLKGFRTFVTSFAPFATARCCEQIKVNLGEMKTPVTIVGIASGFEMEYFGNSHYGYDDIAMMRSISELTILCPADAAELVKMLDILMTYNKPVYLRLTKISKKKLVYKHDFEYRIGKANILKNAGDITIIATGSIVSTAKSVAEKIENERKISCGLIDIHTIKPLDIETIYKVCKESRLIVTLEEHNTIGGLGTSVAEVCASFRNQAELLVIGVPEKHSHVGDYDYLMRAYGLDMETVFNKIMERWEIGQR